MGTPTYKRPTVWRLRNELIPNEYQRLKKILEMKISQCSAVTLIVDIWSSKKMCGYIGFTIEGVTSSYEIFTAFLCIRQMFGKHTGEAILAEFEDVLREWKLKIKVVSKIISQIISKRNFLRHFHFKQHLFHYYFRLFELLQIMART